MIGFMNLNLMLIQIKKIYTLAYLNLSKTYILTTI
jgi:hypothetical protein